MTRWLVILLLSGCNSIYGQSALSDSILRSVSSLKPVEKYHHLYEQAEKYIEVDFSEALDISQAGLAQARLLRQDSLVFKSLMQLGDITLQIPQFNFSDSIYQLAVQLADQMHEPRKKMNA